LRKSDPDIDIHRHHGRSDAEGVGPPRIFHGVT
jgi:hypothetical protein